MQTILLDQVVQRRPADPEQLGSAGDVVLGAAHRLADRLAVGNFPRRTQVDRQHVIAWDDSCLEIEVASGHALSVGHDYGALDAVFQLADIARPAPLVDRLQRVGREAADRVAIRRAMTQSEGNISAAAKLLGISRPTLYDLLKQYRMHA